MSKKTKTAKEPVIQSEMTTVTHEEIFQIVKNNGIYQIGVANNLISKNTFATVEEAKAYIDSKPWELVINVTCLIYDMSKKASK